MCPKTQPGSYQDRGQGIQAVLRPPRAAVKHSDNWSKREVCQKHPPAASTVTAAQQTPLQGLPRGCTSKCNQNKLIAGDHRKALQPITSTAAVCDNHPATVLPGAAPQLRGSRAEQWGVGLGPLLSPTATSGTVKVGGEQFLCCWASPASPTRTLGPQ